MKSSHAVRAAGEVKAVLPSALYRVELDTGQEIVAHLSEGLRLTSTRILPGNQVVVELSPYDHGRGRIVLNSLTGSDPQHSSHV